MLPVSSVIVQDTATLRTTATVTTLVTGAFDQLLVATDPRRWDQSQRRDP